MELSSTTGMTMAFMTDADGNLVADTFTDSVGDYWFNDLLPGEYSIYEIQPDSFVDGIDTVGSVDGVTRGEILENDKFGTVVLEGGDVGVDYDFGEIQTASISGLVHVDSNNNGVYDEGSDELLSGVTVQLLDANGSVVAETVTGESGTYTFEGLRPGEYSIRQIQPDGLFSGAEVVGSNGGEANSNLISSIVLASGEEATGYDFCEHLPAELHGTVFQDGPPIETEDGLPSEGFRDIRDGIFTAGVDQGIEGVVLELYFFNTEDSVNPVQVVNTGSKVCPQGIISLSNSSQTASLTPTIRQVARQVSHSMTLKKLRLLRKACRLSVRLSCWTQFQVFKLKPVEYLCSITLVK